MVGPKVLVAAFLAIAGGIVLLGASGSAQPPRDRSAVRMAPPANDPSNRTEHASPARLGPLVPEAEGAPSRVLLSQPVGEYGPGPGPSESGIRLGLPLSTGDPAPGEENRSSPSTDAVLHVPILEVPLEPDSGVATAPAIQIRLAPATPEAVLLPVGPPPPAPEPAPPEPAPVVSQKKEVKPPEKVEDAGDLFAKFVQLSVPGPDKLFQLESDERLRARMREEAKAHALPLKFEFPEAKAAPPEPDRSPAKSLASLVIEPNYLCSGRLWFEQPRSERYGRELGGLQPFISAGHFYVDLALLPARWLAHPLECYECYPRRQVGDYPWRAEGVSPVLMNPFQD